MDKKNIEKRKDREKHTSTLVNFISRKDQTTNSDGSWTAYDFIAETNCEAERENH